MNNQGGNVTLQRNDVENQFEIHYESNVAFIEYIIKEEKIYLTHTEVPKALEGQGIGSKLVKMVLQYIKDHNMVLVPQCSFVAAYVNKHPEWHSILSEGYQM